jgi:hypothetical protein
MVTLLHTGIRFLTPKRKASERREWNADQLILQLARLFVIVDQEAIAAAALVDEIPRGAQ